MSRFSYLLKLWSRSFNSSLKNSAESDERGSIDSVNYSLSPFDSNFN